MGTKRSLAKGRHGLTMWWRPIWRRWLSGVVTSHELGEQQQMASVEECLGTEGYGSTGCPGLPCHLAKWWRACDYSPRAPFGAPGHTSIRSWSDFEATGIPKVLSHVIRTRPLGEDTIVALPLASKHNTGRYPGHEAKSRQGSLGTREQKQDAVEPRTAARRRLVEDAGCLALPHAVGTGCM